MLNATITVCKDQDGGWEVRVNAGNYRSAHACNSLQSAKYTARRIAALHKGAKVIYPA